MCLLRNEGKLDSTRIIHGIDNVLEGNYFGTASNNSQGIVSWVFSEFLFSDLAFIAFWNQPLEIA